MNKFIRLIFDLNYGTPISYIIKKNEIMSVEQLFKFEIENFMYRHFNNLLPSVFGHKHFKSNTRNTRNGSSFSKILSVKFNQTVF